MYSDEERFDNICLVTHDLFIRLFTLNFLKLDPSLLSNIRHPNNCEIWEIVLGKDGHYRVKTDVFVEGKNPILEKEN